MILSKMAPYVMADIEAGNSVLLRSSSGRGKSDFVKWLFKHLSSGSAPGDWGYQSMFLATQTPPDLIGYIGIGHDEYDNKKYAKSVPTLPLWMQSTEGKPAWAYKRFFLFLDEYGQGEPDVKRASAELLLNGSIGPWKLPPFSVRIAATNRGARYGVTKDFDFVINRRSEYDIQDDLTSWLGWADKPYVHEAKEWHVMPVTKAFGAQYSQVLFEEEPKVQGPWCTPRSLCGADRWLQMIERSLGRIDPSDTCIGEGVAAKIGVAAAAQYVGFLKFRLELPQYADVVADPAGTPIPEKPDMKMLMAYEMAARTDKAGLPAVVAYMQRMPKDLAITYVLALTRRDKMMLIEPAMSAWTAKNATLLAYCQSNN